MHTIVDQHIRHHQKLRPVREIYWSIGINGLGLSLVSIFVPIYLYNLGYSLRTILLVYMVDFAARIILQPLAGRFIARFGPKHGLVLAVFFSIIALMLLTTLRSSPNVLWLIPLASAALNVFHFLAFMTYFARSYEEGKVSKQVSILSQLIITVTTIGPFIGGIIATALGLHIALVIAICFVLASLIPLTASSEPFTRQRFSLRDLPWRQMKTDVLGSYGRAIEARSAKIVWPLAIFLLVGTYAEVGLITTISFLAIIIANRVATVLVKTRPRTIMWVGSIGNAGAHLGKVMVDGSVGATIVNFLDGVTNTFSMIPFQSALYRHARSNNTVSFVTAFNSVNDLGSLSLFAVLFGATFLLPTAGVLILGFILGAIGALLAPAILQTRFTSPPTSTTPRANG